MIIADSFIQSIDDLCRYAESCDFIGVVNPYDGVTYPDINTEIPAHIVNEVIEGIERETGVVPKVKAMFLRMSIDGVNVPHIAHTDNSMGEYSLMLYLSDRDGSGTAMITHKASGISYAPEKPEFINVVVGDQNDLSAWRMDDFCQSKVNRAAIFNASKFHCALPVGGFGSSQKSARIVLTCFFEEA